jgi:uncharacterized damage-inducible protein DinB
MLEDLLRYTQKADALMINAVISCEIDLPKVNTLFSHLLSAQHIWATRILSFPSQMEVWQNHQKESFIAISNSNFQLVKQVLATVPLEQEIHYSNSKGDKFTSTAKDILLHFCNHSTYHRAQIATLLKNAGAVPPITDYMILKRTNQL